MNRDREFVLTLSCRDTTGIVYAVSGLLYQAGCNIIDSQQFGDVDGDDATGLFFMRVHFAAPEQLADVPTLDRLFAHVRTQHGMDARFHALGHRSRVLLMVSKFGHCLNDLLFRCTARGCCPWTSRAIVSNHARVLPAWRLATTSRSTTCRWSTARTPQPRRRHEAQRLRGHRRGRTRIELVVLARYMQILSDDLCRQARGPRDQHPPQRSCRASRARGRMQQAHDRGVKLIGATAHYVTSDLDEGPIIEQDVARVDHSLSADDLTATGRDVECVVLARAVRWHVEHRVLMNGHKTVVFK